MQVQARHWKAEVNSEALSSAFPKDYRLARAVLAQAGSQESQPPWPASF